jgi:hypothetical protein
MPREVPTTPRQPRRFICSQCCEPVPREAIHEYQSFINETARKISNELYSFKIELRKDMVTLNQNQLIIRDGVWRRSGRRFHRRRKIK